jgi:retron-type reverse transcriptase
MQLSSMIFKNQFGFRANHSTNHAISAIVDKIQTAIDQRDLFCGICLDFSKAFDTVNHAQNTFE